MYHATTTSTKIASHESAKLPGYEIATSASRRKIAPGFASPDATGRSAIAVIVQRHLLEDVDGLGLDRPEVAQGRAVPGNRAHERAQRAVARLHLDVQVHAALGADDPQIAKARDRARAGEQVVVHVVERDPVAQHGAN